MGLSTAMAFPFLTLFLSTAVKASPIEIAVFLVVAPLSGVLVSSRLGKLSDRHRIRRRLLIAAGAAGCIAFTATAFVRTYGVLIALTVSVAALAGTMLPQSFAYARAVLGDSDRATLIISRLRTLFSIAWVAGPPLASVLLQVGGFRAVYGMAGAMYALAAVIAWRMLDRRGDALPPPATARAQAAATRPGSARVLWAAIAAFALLQCAGNVGVQALPLLIGHDLGGQARSAGWILGLCAALEIPLMLGLGALSTRMPVYRLLLVGAVCAIAYAVLAAVASATWQLAAGQLINAVSVAAIQGLGISYVQNLLPHEPGRASTLFSNTFPAGAVFAGVIVGAAEHFGYRSAYATASVVAVAGLVLLLTARPTRTFREQAGDTTDVAVLSPG